MSGCQIGTLFLPPPRAAFDDRPITARFWFGVMHGKDPWRYFTSEHEAVAWQQHLEYEVGLSCWVLPPRPG